MPLTHRITYSLDKESHQILAELANKKTNANLGEISTLLIRDALDNVLGDLENTAENRLIKRRYKAAKRAIVERQLHDDYIDWIKLGRDDTEYEADLIEIADKWNLPYPPKTTDPVQADPDLRKIMTKLKEDFGTTSRHLCQNYNYKKDDLNYHLARLKEMGLIKITRNSRGSERIELANLMSVDDD